MNTNGKTMRYGFIGLILGLLLWLTWANTVQPMLAAGDSAGLTRTLVGLPCFLLGPFLIVYGTWRLMRDLFAATRNRGRKGMATQSGALFWLHVWKWALLFLALGAGVMTLGIRIIQANS